MPVVIVFPVNVLFISGVSLLASQYLQEKQHRDYNYAHFVLIILALKLLFCKSIIIY